MELTVLQKQDMSEHENINGENAAQSIKRVTYLAAKRFFDVSMAITGLILFSPILIAVTAAIKAEDGGPVIHTRICTGKNRRQYNMYKFRSMKQDADDIDKHLDQAQKEAYKRECKLMNDPRITNVGAWIRKTSIDELPQLVNVIKGDMSLVGPRPMVNFETEFYDTNLEKVLNATPGITGFWQVNGRSNCTYETGMRQQMELYYADHACLWLDFKIVMRTISAVCKKDGAR